MRNVLACVFCSVFCSAVATAQLQGSWSVEDSQSGTGTACVEITRTGNGTYKYESSSGDSGTIVRVGPGVYEFSSSNGGGTGVIDTRSKPAAWQNYQTGAGGTMKKK